MRKLYSICISFCSDATDTRHGLVDMQCHDVPVAVLYWYGTPFGLVDVETGKCLPGVIVEGGTRDGALAVMLDAT